MYKLKRPFKYSYDGVTITEFPKGYVFEQPDDKACQAALSQDIIEQTPRRKRKKPTKVEQQLEVKD